MQVCVCTLCLRFEMRMEVVIFLGPQALNVGSMYGQTPPENDGQVACAIHWPNPYMSFREALAEGFLSASVFSVCLARHVVSASFRLKLPSQRIRVEQRCNH